MKNFLSILLPLLTLTFGCSRDEDFYIPLTNDMVLEDQIIRLYGNLEQLKMSSKNDLSTIPADSKNPITQQKVLLGKFLFHETGMARNPKKEIGSNTYSCASCHQVEAGFQSGIKQGIGEGGMGFGIHGESRVISPEYLTAEIDIQPIRSPTILNTAYQDVMLWNGQFGGVKTNSGTQANWTENTPKAVNLLGFEGLETQAIAGLGVHRMKCDIDLMTALGYRSFFDAAFPEVPENERYSEVYAGLAIAAYERSVISNEAPFQLWLNGDKNALSSSELLGAQIFFGKGECHICHNGPGLNGMSFHALGMNDLSGNGVHSNVDEATKKGRGGFTLNSDDDYKFKTPTLYNLKDVHFLGHGGSFTTIKEVIQYKNLGVAENAEVPENRISPFFKPLGLSEEEINALTIFLENALYDGNLHRHVPEFLPSGNCFPNADSQSKLDMGCD